MVAAPASVAAPHPTLVRAVKALTDHCDGALTLDGVGWNGVDTFLGHVLAKIPPAQWTRKETYWAWYATQKYKKQLGAYGIVWDEIPPVPLVERPQDWYRERKDRVWRERQEVEQEARIDRDYQEYQRARERQEQAKAAQGRVILPLTPDTVIIRYPYDPVLKDKVKAYSYKQPDGYDQRIARWDQDNKRWWAAVNVDSAPVLIKLASDLMFEFGPGVLDMLQGIVGQAARLAVASRAGSTDFRFDGLLREPYPFQWAGIEYAMTAKRTFIADAPGLGKTIQAIAAMWKLGAKFKLVIAPANVKWNWKREIEITLPDQVVCVIEGMKPWAVYPEADWYIINHNITAAHLPFMQQQVAIDGLIIDEGHYLTNPKVARTKAVQALVEHEEIVGGKKTKVRDIEHIFILTGTAILNRPKEVLPQLGILGRLKDIARDEWQFKKLFCGLEKVEIGRTGKSKWQDTGATGGVELNRKMRQYCYVRREKVDVLTELPPKRRVVLDVPLGNRDEYDRAERDMVRWLADKAASERSFRASIAGLSPEMQRAAIQRRREESVNKTTAAEALVRFNTLKRLAAQGKIESVKEWVSDFLASGEKLVVFAWYRETVDELCKALEPIHGKPVPAIHGGVESHRRQAIVDQFQNDPDTRLIVCNIIAAGEGITLTAASDVFFAEMGWNPGKQDQAEDRVHRIGQADSVTAWYMLANQTIEADIYDIIAEKRIIVTAVNEGVELPDTERHMMREVAARLRKRHKPSQQPLPLQVAAGDDSPPWDEK